MPTVLIGGGSGLLGMRLSHLLKQKNYKVIHLSRSRNLDTEFPRYEWNLDTGEIDQEAIEKADFVINLAGAGIADQRWTASRKKLIIDSRVKGMRLFQAAFKKLGKSPKAFIAASATGFYGDRGEEWLNENSKPGAGFLSESTQAWENSTEGLESLTRLVTIRIGVVLSGRGGALPKMVLPQRFGLGAYFSSGKQFFPWIHIDDLCGIFLKSLEDEHMSGTFNGVAPNPVNNLELTKTIAAARNKKVLLLPIPAFLLRLAMGEMADMVLTGARVSSEKIKNRGFEFQYSKLLPALEDLFAKEN